MEAMGLEPLDRLTALALRSLQESVLLLAPRFASRFEDLRYRLYAIERSAIGAARAADCLRGINLCVLVDGRSDPSAFARLVESRLVTGGRVIQIRDKKRYLRSRKRSTFKKRLVLVKMCTRSRTDRPTDLQTDTQIDRQTDK